jgi:transcriptional regulator with XRE-family HTH domain
MPTRSNPNQEGFRIAARVVTEVADELREARVGRGLSQAQLAKALATQRLRISAVERRVPKAMTLDHLARHAAALGLKLSVKLYPVGEPIRDVAQVRYINQFVARVGTSWRVRLDVPMPLAGDLRAIDVVLDGACVIAVEVVTRLRDVQAVLRAGQLKQRDFGATRLILVVPGPKANRAALAAARPALIAAFDLDSQRTLRLLAAGRDPGRDAIVILS